MNTNTRLAAGLGSSLQVPAAATREGRTWPPANPPGLVPVPVPALLGLPPAPPPGSGSPALPSGKRSARFYAWLLGGDPRRKSSRQVPQPPGVPNAAVPERHLPPEGAGPPGPRAPPAAPLAQGKAFCAGTPARLGLTGTHSPVACSGRPCTGSRCLGSPRGAAELHRLTRRVSFPAAWGMCLGPSAAIGPCPHREGTRFSSRSRSETTEATVKSQERRCRPSREISVEKVHTAPHTG